MTTTEFIYKAKQAVGDESGYGLPNVQPVWFGYVLGNMKAILCVPETPEQDIYEVTYNRSKCEIYVDRYEKVSNTCYSPEEL